MRPDPGWTPPRQRRLTTTLVAGLLVVALALVTPVAGPSRGAAHDLLSVHLLFPHHHDSYVPHGAVERDNRADERDDRPGDDALTSLERPAFSAAGPLADAASLASKGLVMAGLLFTLSLRVLGLGGGWRVPGPRQRWDTVPIRPPR
jgi:hypothetical protein